MNKIILYIKILIPGVLLLHAVSCSDFLDKHPTDRLSSSTFWQNEKEADMALSGVYARLYSYPFTHKDGEWEIMAGEAEGIPGGVVVGLAQGKIYPTSGGMVGSIYNACFNGISACNFFLDNIDRAPITPEKLTRYKGEVLFLRALFYFTLTESYGGVPLYTSPVTIDGAKVQQSTKEEVVKQILEDLDVAIVSLPNIPYTDGHAVKGSALGLKAKVLLHQNRWEEAANTAYQVIQDSRFSLFGNFRTMFLATGQANNPEIMFSTRYSAPDIYTNMDHSWSWIGRLNPRQELVDAYECIDGLPIDQSPLYDLENWRLNRDPRMLLTIKAQPDSVVNSSGITIGFPYDHLGGKGYRPVKYCDWDALPAGWETVSEQDWILLRYADVLLMYAEAKNEHSGPDATVYQAVNQVRDRVGMPPLPDGLSKEQMRQRIRNERRVELAIEGIRWGDVKRWRTAQTYIPTLVDTGGEPRVFDPNKHYVLPFPQSEVDINTNLMQNPGY